MKHALQLNGSTVGDGEQLLVIAGPCVLENESEAMFIAESLQSYCKDAGANFVFKGSFDKANRTSVFSKRGPGIKHGLRILDRIKEQLSVCVTTDIHEPSQASEVAKVADIIQIPAFLSRQTDLLVSAAQTGAIVNVKKGQFISPAEMEHVVTKLKESNCEEIILTERGTFFVFLYFFVFFI